MNDLLMQFSRCIYDPKWHAGVLYFERADMECRFATTVGMHWNLQKHASEVD